MSAIVSCVMLAATVVAAPAASAQAWIDHVVARTDRWLQVFVWSPAMDRVVQVDVLLPRNTAGPHPTLYLLDGNSADESVGQSTWTLKTDAVRFFADKPVTVVLPVGGGGTFYTDWLRDDPELGRNQWETFLAEELPPLIDTRFHGSGANAVAGVSMGGQAAMALTFRNPALYRAAAAYSGCLFTSTLGQGYVRTAVVQRGGDPDNMWGRATDPQWRAHDVSLHVGDLRGKSLFVSAGSGIPRPTDAEIDRRSSWPDTLIESVVIERGAYECTGVLDARLRAQGVPATVTYYTFGVHSWPYWQAPLHDSWPVLARGLGVG
ncbi:S-formylglutathione hydrolase FrmB [Nocardia transvalensis]|uniref:S-formylglutathione hydrolase FrmB n=1 Tax=Nocardia transvalensis TaxID=37333 RepID=A0A7W9PF10_9NOCA|nr:alpha/beta hydrolase family protein [Nocardia transvalensis]MBB5914877.1 S-formylglutathione hydrolase FrmB [Nocardia transvalensis]